MDEAGSSGRLGAVMNVRSRGPGWWGPLRRAVPEGHIRPQQRLLQVGNSVIRWRHQIPLIATSGSILALSLTMSIHEAMFLCQQ